MQDRTIKIGIIAPIALIGIIAICLIGMAYAHADSSIGEFQTDSEIYPLDGVIIMTGTTTEFLSTIDGKWRVFTPIEIHLTGENCSYSTITYPHNYEIYHKQYLSYLDCDPGFLQISITYGHSSYNKLVILEDQSFIIKSDKDKYAFGDRALFIGKLKEIGDWPHVDIEVLDQNGQLLETVFYNPDKTASTQAPSLYSFKAFPRNSDGYAINQNIGVDDLDRLEPGEFRFTIALTPLDFVEGQTYSVLAKYDKRVVSTEFTLYDKFAHMTDVFEIYPERKNYRPGDTVTISGLAPFAVSDGGGKSGFNFIPGPDDKTKSKEENTAIKSKQRTEAYQKYRDDQYLTNSNSDGGSPSNIVTFTITHPDSKKIQKTVGIDNGEFTIEFDIPEYFGTSERIFGQYS